MYYTANIWIFSHVFHIFNYLRSSISVQMGKKIFAIIYKCERVQINIGGLEKNQKLTSKGGFIWHTGVTEYNTRNIFLQKSCRK